MNPASPSPSTQHRSSLKPHLQPQLDAWRDLLAQCALKPSRKRVHALRSFTLRLRAALEFRLPEEAGDSAAAPAFRRWKRAGKKLRRALEPVRNADVHLAQLAGLRGVLGRPASSQPQGSPRCLREIGKLERRLKRQRQKGADALTAFFDARGKRLNRLSHELDAASPRMPSTPGIATQDALRIFTALAGELPGLGSANLHAYRKRLKQPLYLAEFSAPADPAARRLAVAMRKMHAAAGKWHDWQALASEAGRVLPRHGNRDGLVPVLNNLAEEALKRALGQCRRSTASLLKNPPGIPPSQRRKPVARVEVHEALPTADKSLYVG